MADIDLQDEAVPGGLRVGDAGVAPDTADRGAQGVTDCSSILPGLRQPVTALAQRDVYAVIRLGEDGAETSAWQRRILTRPDRVRKRREPRHVVFSERTIVPRHIVRCGHEHGERRDRDSGKGQPEDDRPGHQKNDEQARGRVMTQPRLG